MLHLTLIRRVSARWLSLALVALIASAGAESAAAAPAMELPPRAGELEMSSQVYKLLARPQAKRPPSRRVLRLFHQDRGKQARIAATPSEPNVSFVCNGIYQIANFVLFSNATFGAAYGEPVFIRQGFRFWSAAGRDETVITTNGWHSGSANPRVVSWHPRQYVPRLNWVRIVLQTWSQRTGWLTWTVKPTLDAPNGFGYNAQVYGDWCQVL